MATQTAPRIKLIIANDDYKERLKWLNEVSWDIQRARNSAVRACVEKMHRQSRQDLPDITTHPQFFNEKGKLTDYLYMYQTRPEKYLTGAASLTLLSEAENAVSKDFSNWFVEILTGKRKIPYYKDQNIPIRSLSRGSVFYEKEGKYYFQGAGLSYNTKPTIFEFVNVHKNKSVSSILNNILLGTYKFCDSKMVKDGKFWYLHISYSFSPTKLECLDPLTVVGVDMGFINPVYLGVSNNLERQAIGDSKQLIRFKTGIKQRRRKLQKEINNLGEGSKGHGYNRKAQILERLSKSEKNFVQTFNHTISKRVIDFAEINKAGVIQLEQLTQEVKKGAFLTAYWSYFQLQQDIEYKAKNKGIEVKYVYPHYTSQMCSKCGYTHEDNRKVQLEFHCINCDTKMNADYNASLNIARSQEYCKTKEESSEGGMRYIKSNGYVFRVYKKGKNIQFINITKRELNLEIKKISVDKIRDKNYIQEHVDKHFL